MPTDYTKKVTDSFSDTLGDLIAASKKRGKSLNSIAKETGISAGSLSAYTNQSGDGAPRACSITSLYTLAKYFDVSADYMLGLSVAPTRNSDVAAVVDYTGLSPKAVNILHTLSNSSSYTRDLRISFINHILESDILWNRIMEHLQSAYQLRKGYESELDPEAAEKLEESAAFIKALNFGGLTKYTVSEGSFAADIQIQLAADSSKDLFRALIADILKEEDNNGQH